MSTGIIGGADGPTAIYIAGQFHWIALLVGAVAAVIAALVIYLVWKKKSGR
ncbi:hypothetical protein H8711_04450 [Clostridiaceae bacterium NSJ-31]|uniref:Uncharacterized protein n=1 Tax=Ligaoa zhengdingensis TaxID=2763658 RepID=A0A926I4F5_9FIRM|nr:sodium ion-translocating decarboxylase subunit beta [Ligaoa zhengdingensis]MBC8546186.1 hypothetical protein [Ligaoa zhengdingensis]